MTTPSRLSAIMGCPLSQAESMLNGTHHNPTVDLHNKLANSSELAEVAVTIGRVNRYTFQSQTQTMRLLYASSSNTDLLHFSHHPTASDQLRLKAALASTKLSNTKTRPKSFRQFLSGPAEYLFSVCSRHNLFKNRPAVLVETI
jgi:hypothetical protein